MRLALDLPAWQPRILRTFLHANNVHTAFTRTDKEKLLLDFEKYQEALFVFERMQAFAEARKDEDNKAL